MVGLGRFGGGVGAARWLVERGARVTVTDLSDPDSLRSSLARIEEHVESGRIELVLGSHDGIDPSAYDLIVPSPAVPVAAPLLETARAAGVRVVGEVELYLERTVARVVALTGTQGKSSTATFCGQLLRGAAIDGRVGGNIGGSLLEELAEETADTVRVLELSSYQLEALTDSPPRVACAVAITNVLEDHLDRHGDVARYAAAKARIVELCRTDGRALLPHAGPLGSWEPENVAVDRHGPEEAWRVTESRVHLNGTTLDLADSPLPRFQGWNVLIAGWLATQAGAASNSLVRTLPKLRAPAHRFARLPRFGPRSLEIIDNGVATTPDATLGVLADVPRGATVLIGGHSKGLDWTPLGEALAHRGDRVVAFGAAAEEVHRCLEALDVPCRRHASLGEAVEDALEGSPASASVLFSPSCSSFDAYSNFQERADEFQALVQAALHAHPASST
ncbi:MAG: UDP-N-acetylmuramoyl-L-alanine--D-glutamate ligase [Planctomycetota bacterium]